MTTVIDTDALLGLIDQTDAHHIRAKMFAQQLVQKAAHVYLIPTTLTEFAQIATDRIGLEQTQETVELFVKSGYSMYPISNDITQRAVSFHKTQTSKKESLFDCYVMAAAKKLAADCVFSFDKGYKKNGFMLIEDFFRQQERK